MDINLEIIKLVLPSLLTVIGWLLAAWWAIEQVNLAHEKNIKLQKDLMNESHRRDIARELIAIYKSITQSGNDLRQAMTLFQINHILETDDGVEGVSFNARNLVSPINDAYNKLSQEITRLDMWLKVAGKHLPDPEHLLDAISEFHRVFSFGSGDDGAQQGLLWSRYQSLLAVYQSELEVSDQKFADVATEINASIALIFENLTNGTAKIHSNMCGT